MKKKKAIAVPLTIIVALLLLTIGTIGYLFFASFLPGDQSEMIYIDRNDNLDSVYTKLSEKKGSGSLLGFKMLNAITGYGEHIREGRYEIGRSKGILRIFRDLRNGRQEPVQLVIPSVRTMNNLAARLAKELQVDSATWAQKFSDTTFLAKYNVSPATVPTLFLPNTYEVYWTITPEKLMERMQNESKTFWTTTRKEKAAAAGLTPEQVITLASIVEQESAYGPEKPMIAGMYLNRLHRNIKLQADPTVKFALQDFGLRRILNQHLTVDSPYNTYRNEGLPPGPICIPSIESIDAVLNYAKHDYIFMCAKEDFSGRHNFAATDVEHMANAQKYAEALNRRGIK